MELLKVVLVLCMACLGSSRRLQQFAGNTVSVMDYGAVGDGSTDDSQAFLKAWEAVCSGESGSSDLYVPMMSTFLLKSVKFEGPCKSPFNLRILGTIVAPRDPSTWESKKTSWIIFSKVEGLAIYGNGVIDGQGSDWWKLAEKKGQKIPRPATMAFRDCENLELRGLNFLNSPSKHISITGCNGLTLSSLHITAPESSPNTDGMDISRSTNIQINDCNIGTGDDCIAFGTGTSFINVTGVTCGPGHGISIGSLGEDKSRAEVEEIYVRNCTFKGTTNGARIKTWQGGSGFARKISFEDIILDDASNPIFINQYYCILKDSCANQTSAVEISDITYDGIRGTCATNDAIKLSCSESVGCTNIVLNNINIISSSLAQPASASCTNAYGTSSDTNPADWILILVVLGMVSSSTLSFQLRSLNTVSYNVIDFGAVGDGKNDDSQAFINAWIKVCEAQINSISLVIPSGHSFLLGPTVFEGPCKPSRIDVQVYGCITAHTDRSAWKWKRYGKQFWLMFSRVDGLTVHGNGQINGHGSNWWNQRQPSQHHDVSDDNRVESDRPTALHFFACNNLVLDGLSHINSPSKHVSMYACNNARISNLHIIAPKDSPNTDGIVVSQSNHVQVRDCIIATGDDCVAIIGNSSNINITKIACGPGHGISIGSLGMNGTADQIEDVHISDCSFEGTLNGVRIKTWQGGAGYARKISFTGITLKNAYNPIIIDQFYYPHHNCKNKSTSAVKVSDVTYSGIHGTSMMEKAINFSCNQINGCSNIIVDHVNITLADHPGTNRNQTYAFCFNAHGRSSSSIPKVDCL